MIRPPFPLVCSGRRSTAGPGRQFGWHSLSIRSMASPIVVALAATLVLSPVVVAVLSMIFTDPLAQPSVRPIVPVNPVVILESGRVLFTLALATRVMRTAELE
jgi:hypothetical protein